MNVDECKPRLQALVDLSLQTVKKYMPVANTRAKLSSRTGQRKDHELFLPEAQVWSAWHRWLDMSECRAARLTTRLSTLMPAEIAARSK